MENNVPQFKTIRQTAATGILKEFTLRRLVEEGNCPGFYVGNRFMVNVPALVEHLSKISRENVKEGK